MDRIICEFKKKNDEKIEFALREYEGSRFYDLRAFYDAENGDGFKPTRKGVTFSVDFLPILKEAIEKVLKEEKEE